ncbi:RAMP superfamily CRISPR-associated protein [Goodfellowiella coeruleoviolacea]|nr:RAMP superfamily CRISPR-associated protein [Goodfellowiella coeruleoviolacea]
MGRAPEDEQVSSSALWFLGTSLVGPDPVVRARTAVDRVRGSAATSMLRRHEHLAVGTRVVVYLRLTDIALRDELLAALATWAPVIGGGRTAGFGRAAVTKVQHQTVDLGTPEGRRLWLTSGGPDMFADAGMALVDLPEPTEPTPVVDLAWSIVDGLHIGNGETVKRQGASDIATVICDHDSVPFVPGSTWKGVLRSRCEFILRSLGAPACSPSGLDGSKANPCGSCLICQAFGFVNGDIEPPARRGLLEFADSPIADADVVAQPHVALDRVFGGARKNALFAQEVVRGGQLSLTVRATDEVPPGIRALLLLACYDIHYGFAGIGKSTTRGLGTLRLLDDDPEELRKRRADAIDVLTRALRSAKPEEVAAQ